MGIGLAGMPNSRRAAMMSLVPSVQSGWYPRAAIVNTTAFATDAITCLSTSELSLRSTAIIAQATSPRGGVHLSVGRQVRS